MNPIVSPNDPIIQLEVNKGKNNNNEVNENRNQSSHKEKLNKRNYINLVITVQLRNLVKIIKSNFSPSLLKAFFRIKKVYNHCKLNFFKSKLIFNNLNKHLNLILHVYKSSRRKILYKAFHKYRNIIVIRNKLHKLKHEVEQNLDKRKEKELNIIDSKIKEKEKELSENKKQLEINAEHTNELQKRIKQHEENLLNFAQLYKKLEKEKKLFEDEIKNKEKNKKDNEQYFNSLETKVKEYESEIKNLNEQNSEKEYSLSLFIKEMNEMLEAHEKINSDILTISNDNEENKQPQNNTNNTTNKPLNLSQKPSIKSGLISSNNLSFKVLQNNSGSNYTIINQNSNKTQVLNQASKGIFINPNISTPSINKLNYMFNKNNVSSTNSSVNIFKSKI